MQYNASNISVSTFTLKLFKAIPQVLKSTEYWSCKVFSQVTATQFHPFIILSGNAEHEDETATSEEEKEKERKKKSQKIGQITNILIAWF